MRPNTQSAPQTSSKTQTATQVKRKNWTIGVKIWRVWEKFAAASLRMQSIAIATYYWLTSGWKILNNRWWLWELASLVVSTLAMGAVFILLLEINNMALSNWDFPIQPNSMFSIFMTIAKSTLLVPITEIISQSKWAQFHKAPRPLMALQDFDEASRGPVGAVFLLVNPRVAGVIAWIGALLTVVSLALDPFTQQIISFPPRTVISVRDTASIQVAQHIVNGIDPTSMIGVAINGIYLKTNATMKVTCTTTSCQWNFPVASLGVCSMCRDITSEIVPRCQTQPGPMNPGINETWSFSTTNCTYIVGENISLPVYMQTLYLPAADGRHAEYASQYSKTIVNTISWGKGLGDVIADAPKNNIAWISTTLLYTTFFNTSRSDMPLMSLKVLRPNISACGIYWCGQVYNNLNASNGAVVDPKLNATYPVYRNFTPDGQVFETKFGENQDLAEVFTIAEADRRNFPGDPIFIVSNEAEETAECALNAALTLWDSSGNDVFSDFPAKDTGLDVLSLSPGLSNGLDGFTGAQQLQDIWDVFARIAQIMTEEVRELNSSDTVAGAAFVTQRYIQVSWQWMSLPIIVLLSVNILLVVVILRNRKRQMRLWKSSSIALLLHQTQGFENEFSRLSNLEDLEEFANELTVQLKTQPGQGSKFVKVY